MVTTRITRVAGEPFKSEGKVLVSAGWLAVYGREAQGDEPTLAPIKPSESVATEKIDVVHAHMVRAAMAAVPLARLAGVPAVVQTCHGREAWRTSWLKRRYWID